MMDELTKIDPTKVIYDSPSQCLDAFIAELAAITSNHTQKNTHITQLEQKVKQFEHKNLKNQEQSQADRARIQELENLVRDGIRKAGDMESRLREEIDQLKQVNKHLNDDLQSLQNQMDMK